jgi:DNA-binding NarL/FixJ family response regulator
MTLTEREQRLVRAIMLGGTNRDVASRLRIREQTVKNSLSRVYRKLGVRNRVELAMYGSRHMRET